MGFSDCIHTGGEWTPLYVHFHYTLRLKAFIEKFPSTLDPIMLSHVSFQRNCRDTTLDELKKQFSLRLK